MTTEIHIKRLTKEAKIPTRGSDSAAGMDLYAAESLRIPAGEHRIISTGISVAIPDNTYLRIAPRSGLAAKAGIDVLAGVVDSDYRGEIKVILINLGNATFNVNIDDRIAQAILQPVIHPTIVEKEELITTIRGVNGFGSTGV